MHYNYLSQLQSLHGTILVTRRDTRALFLALGREPKSRSNLEQLLRIAMDMIWLDKKERQRKRRRMAPVSLTPTAAAGVATAPSAPSTLAGTEARSEGFIYNGSTADQYPVHHRHHSRADDYHGLRVSEYTILMNWIGTVTNLPSIEESNGVGFNGAIASSSSTPGDQQMQQQQSREHQHSRRRQAHSDLRRPITVEDPVERAWAIWQDFLLTGMKPDVVLYTALIDMLLKANKFSKADQIWNHMHHQTGNTSTITVTGAASSGVMPIVDTAGGALVARTLSRGAFASKTNTVADQESHDKMHQHHLRSLNQSRQRPSIYQFKNKNVSGGHGNAVGGDSHVAVPNVQTLSVLMQNHVRYRDLEGVAETYKKLLQQPQQNQQRQPQLHHDQQRGVNNVLLNQVLTVLIDLRENKAAREIYATMKASTSEHEERLTNEGQVNDGRVSSYTRPLHHMTHQRRSAWKQGTKDRPLTKSTASTAGTAAAGTGSTNALSSMIQPDETTHRLMLQLARQEQDAELESQILDELYPFEKPPCL
ncbi:hypothetical protein BG011_007812 [Mortierella polycephala]|uniref:Uncharacterized protein n=1 Tax=Mortierella polycephala TaxID=41804 RepID=A0A9P6PQX6_9FUNG|nr:hypothetical protein BG011_007812 [Mortierella polycephala]